MEQDWGKFAIHVFFTQHVTEQSWGEFMDPFSTPHVEEQSRGEFVMIG